MLLEVIYHILHPIVYLMGEVVPIEMVSLTKLI